MATKINIGTKKAEELIHDMNFRHPKGTTLYEVYGRISKDKRDSWQKICSECTSLHGEKLHIVGASSYNYSCIYAYPVVSDETGKVTAMVLRKETVGNTYELEMPIQEYLRQIG